MSHIHHNINDLKCVCTTNPQLHEYYIEYKKHDEIAFERWMRKRCTLLDIIYWTFDDWRFERKMYNIREDFIKLYGKKQLPICKLKEIEIDKRCGRANVNHTHYIYHK